MQQGFLVECKRVPRAGRGSGDGGTVCSVPEGCRTEQVVDEVLLERVVLDFLCDILSVVRCSVDVCLPPVLVPHVLVFRPVVGYRVYREENIVVFRLEKVARLGEYLLCGIPVVYEGVVAALPVFIVVETDIAKGLDSGIHKATVVALEEQAHVDSDFRLVGELYAEALVEFVLRVEGNLQRHLEHTVNRTGVVFLGKRVGRGVECRGVVQEGCAVVLHEVTGEVLVLLLCVESVLPAVEAAVTVPGVRFEVWLGIMRARTALDEPGRLVFPEGLRYIGLYAELRHEDMTGAYIAFNDKRYTWQLVTSGYSLYPVGFPGWVPGYINYR